ncbi:Zn-ribbon domain-containing OB-fold protein [Paraburkholderia caballeronis]|uniref:Zn-ribbon domain-containing OB-fold protein n=1 Tax=Paraburkholderia caballeronis TaxID=416943 RepID=UPI00106654B9|nr:OB-fold domain-containing protein [Paraburkholderia caballeronis]TDV19690.1 putative OB-fold protein [Paraburkholderia caballeronis]TDV22289.1 putative OB-fold protein [Paraburkholderia caballeronis]TDV29193.1 putative OB-fold protein [Paraburkholderia caballeronis]
MTSSPASTTTFYLPEGLPSPAPEPDGLSAPYWDGLRESRLRVQRCAHCGTWQFGPEWICHGCHAFDPAWHDVEPSGRIYSWERVWHPSHPVLANATPYLVVLVELPHAGNVRMIGNLLGDPAQQVVIGASVRGVFEHHDDAPRPYSLLHWTVAG